MDWVIIILLIVVAIIIALLLFQDKIFKKNIKSSVVKKDEILQQYKTELKKILDRYKDNKSEQKKQKKLFLQKVTSELSRNIYFTASENKQIIQELVLL